VLDDPRTDSTGAADVSRLAHPGAESLQCTLQARIIDKGTVGILIC
jgi:hypothetical protein